MRVEIKMPYNSDQIIMIEKNLASIKELRKHHPDRVVNSIYYDNLNFSIDNFLLSFIFCKNPLT